MRHVLLVLALLLASAPSTLAAQDTPAPSSVASDSQPTNLGGLALTIGGGFVGAFGAVLFLVSAFDVATVQNAVFPTRWSDVSSAYSQAYPLSVAGGVVLGVGVAALALGIVLLSITVGGGRDHTTLGLGPGSLALRGTF